MRCSPVVVLSFAFVAACAGSSKPAPSTTASASATPPAAVTAAPLVPPAPTAPASEHAQHTMEPWTLGNLARGAKLLGDMGKVHREVSTQSSEAQAYFDQGLALTYGFNHDEAARSFAKATEIDPSCAMCFWGAAYTLGPNYNMPMLPDRAKAAWQAITSAQATAQRATPIEKALIDALAKRYPGPDYVEPPAMQPYVEAYAKAMRELAQQFPDDLDVQTLYAEAQMNVSPWKLWTADGKPNPGTEDAVKALELVLKRDPEHVGANHFYIHAVEASKTPQRAVPSAERLGKLVPGAGHLVHMPAHIFQRVGRYADASDANRRAIVADQGYLEKTSPPGYYPFYLGHNYGFLAYSSSMEGRSAEALAAARKAATSIPRDVVCGMPGMDFFLSEPLLVMVRFGRWDDILNEPAPDAKYQVLTALHHHAQGMALAAKGRLDEAKTHASAIRDIAASVPEQVLAGLNSGKLVLELAAKVVDARIADAEKSPDAVKLWEDAVALEDTLAYNEPADWFYPTRHYLGAALLDAGKPKDATLVYEADLARHPKNGWSLFGLWQAAKARHLPKAPRLQKEFEEAWKSADVQITRTAF